VTAFASPAAFAFLAVALAGIGAIPPSEAMWATAAVALAFVPTGWWAGASVRRRLAEASLVPAAFAMTMFGDETMRRMVVPPLLLLAIWAVVSVVWDRVPERRRPALAALVGLAVRAAVGLGLSDFGVLHVAFAFGVAAILPWMAMHRWGRRAAELGAFIGGILPWQSWPLVAGVLVVVSLALGLIGGTRDRDHLVQGWMPGLGAVALLAAALAAWPGIAGADLFPSHGWLARTIVIVALVITPRMRPGVAGIVCSQPHCASVRCRHHRPNSVPSSSRKNMGNSRCRPAAAATMWSILMPKALTQLPRVSRWRSSASPARTIRCSPIR
jgi:hypothetical protein